VPELPEVEVLVRHLQPSLRGKVIRAVEVRRPKVIAPTARRNFSRTLRGARFDSVVRRGKFLLFKLSRGRQSEPLRLLGHLGMTGRMYLVRAGAPLPKHTSVVFRLGRQNFVFEDPRYFGRLTLDLSGLERLGPEPLDNEVAPESFVQALSRSRQPIKVKLLDQSIVAGVGNIYASETLFRAGLSPMMWACQLQRAEVERLWRALRETLVEAVQCGSTVPLNFGGSGERDGLFYFGRAPGAPDFYAERLRVYDRASQPCPVCGTAIQRLVQAARSTYYCARCQPMTRGQRSGGKGQVRGRKQGTESLEPELEIPRAVLNQEIRI
jgi:formamidopyrimidine-DNA glycosylase